MLPKQLAVIVIEKITATPAVNTVWLIETLARTYAFTETMIAETIGIVAETDRDLHEQFQNHDSGNPAN